MAAHPDDENTRIITSMANDKLATAAYLSLTRGDGGQNLIGAQIRDQLGLIRTQELLAARSIDGGIQYFSRANDFGFSKSADETFSIWGREEITSDVVKVFRQFQPDIIITRFPADERAGHGHHTASAMLAQEAFDLAADPTKFSESANQFGVWQVKRLYTNTGRWWNNTITEATPGVITLNVGGYSTLLGKSFTEIAAVSRSQHKSQGFGSAQTRGRQVEFLEYVKGEQAKVDIFEGINTTWTRIKGGAKIQSLVEKAIRDFDIEHPETIVPQLLVIRNEIQKLENSVWSERKLNETEELIKDCLGVFIEATAQHFYTSPGQSVVATVEIVNRSAAKVEVACVSSSIVNYDSSVNTVLKNNIPLQLKVISKLPATTAYSDPYWLRKTHSAGLFTVSDKQLIGKPENEPAVTYLIRLLVEGQTMDIEIPLRYKWTDPAKGELYRPVEIVPAVVINAVQNSVVFPDLTPRPIELRMQSTTGASVTGKLKIQLPAGWSSVPAEYDFILSNRDEERSFQFMIAPSIAEGVFTLKAVAHVKDDTTEFDRSLRTISYDHFPVQLLLPGAGVQAVRVDLKKNGKTIGYINGAGDDVPAALVSMGYDVVELKDGNISSSVLSEMNAVVLGIRALNTNERMVTLMPVLLEYAQRGGTLVIQYNTNFDLETDTFSPYPLTISRDRVTQEDAEVRLLKPDHPVLNTPNKITANDFKGWVQERGLYFPNKWDAAYEAILSMNDRGEPARDGGLLIAQYGSGYFVYTSLSFFRQLPEGVPGALKLFANVVSLQKPADKVTHEAGQKGKSRRNR